MTEEGKNTSITSLKTSAVSYLLQGCKAVRMQCDEQNFHYFGYCVQHCSAHSPTANPQHRCDYVLKI